MRESALGDGKVSVLSGPLSIIFSYRLLAFDPDRAPGVPRNVTTIGIELFDSLLCPSELPWNVMVWLLSCFSFVLHIFSQIKSD